jgi:serine/threonine-protein kinase HipA
MCKCLYCYKELEGGQKDFHPRCARKFFGTKDVPLLEYKHEELDQLAEQVIRSQTSLTGVQKEVENFSYTFTNSVSYSKSET